jgi:heme A synthase
VSVVAAGVAIRSEKPLTQRAGWICASLLVAQLAIGALNIALSAPGWMQLIHLAMATFVWIAFVVMAFAERTTYGSPAPISVAESAAGS